MSKRMKSWHPSADEIERILAEMRPIIAEFAKRAGLETSRCTSNSLTLTAPGR